MRATRRKRERERERGEKEEKERERKKEGEGENERVLREIDERSETNLSVYNLHTNHSTKSRNYQRCIMIALIICES